jgi:hypothetical protein
MKLTILTKIIILLFFVTDLLAQDESYLGIAIGAALPQGVFAEKDYQNESAGYAGTGFMFSFDAAWFPDDYLGLGASITYASNNPDKKQYLEDFKNDLNSSYPNFGEFLDSNLVFDYGVWKYLNLYIGPNFTAAAGSFNFDLRVMAGLTLAWQPSQTIDARYESGSTFSRKVDPKPVATLGYSVGGGIRYALSSGFVVRLMADYANSKPTFEITENTVNVETEELEQFTREVSVPIKNLHVGIGIAYNFDL